MAVAALTVSQVNTFVKSLLEGDGRLSNVLVTGEISNFTDHYRSGHLYFSLKDERSVLKAVMFAGSAKRLRFRPTDGMKVIIRGRVSVYEPSGQYQLYAEEMQPDGLGALSLQYEQLKNRLEEEGLFDTARKRSLPRYPRRIGVITSPTGAAVQDILQITARRWPLAEIVFCPVLVQGEGAARQLTDAVKRMNEANACEVMIIGRGGGSLEDLWAFNNEELARAVAFSRIPVVSAVGHETDFTICDFAADLRAPTPSAAAELVSPELGEEKQRLSAMHRYFCSGAKETVEELRQELDLLLRDSPLGDPQKLTDSRKQALAQLSDRLVKGISNRLAGFDQQLSLASGRLDALSPLKILGRGYSMVTNEQGAVIDSGRKLSVGERVTIRFSSGEALADIVKIEECNETGRTKSNGR